MAAEMSRMNDTLDELLKVAKTPDQTWAFEQFSIAQDAFHRNLIDESYEYINKAITGDNNNAGYRLEHRFYTLRGLIHLGNYKNCTDKYFDIPQAIEEFLLASKYSSGVDKKASSRNYGLAGYACYCIGNFEDAKKYLRQSITLNPNDGLSKYDLAKVHFHEEDTVNGKIHFKGCLLVDHMYGIRAASDPDLLKNKSYIEDVIQECIREVRTQIDQYVKYFREINYHHLETSVKYAYKYSNFDFLKEMKEYFQKESNLSLGELLNYNDKIYYIEKDVREGFDDIKKKINKSIRDVKSSQSKNKRHKISWPVVIAISIILSLLSSAGGDGAGNGLATGLLGGLIFGIPVGYIVSFILEIRDKMNHGLWKEAEVEKLNKALEEIERIGSKR